MYNRRTRNGFLSQDTACLVDEDYLGLQEEIRDTYRTRNASLSPGVFRVASSSMISKSEVHRGRSRSRSEERKNNKAPQSPGLSSSSNSPKPFSRLLPFLLCNATHFTSDPYSQEISSYCGMAEPERDPLQFLGISDHRLHP